MSAFIGGSAYNMAHQIAEGYILISSNSIRKFQTHESKTLEAELDKIARELRAEISPPDDSMAIQKKNRKLGRISQAQLIIRGRLNVRKP